MMITIHGLPLFVKYADLKTLIKQECKITDFILDSLTIDNEGSKTKKVRVGLADASEGNHLIKHLDGYCLSGHVLRLIPVGKSAQVNAPQQNTYDSRGSYQLENDYLNQGSNRNIDKNMEAPRSSVWTSSNQWTPNQPMHPQVHNTYNYQQPMSAPYGQASTVIRPQFEPHDVLPTHGPQTQGYVYSQKRNLINLGPHRNAQSSALREIPTAASRPVQPNRIPAEGYDVSEKPITIMKDNFQGPTQYNLLTGHNPASEVYQSASKSSPWTSQQQSKQYDKLTPAVFDKTQYDDRKYDRQNVQQKHPPEMSKTDLYKGYDKRRDFSPPKRTESAYERGLSSERHMSPSDRPTSYIGRVSPGRKSPGRRFTSPARQTFSERHSSERRISPDRRSSQPNRHPAVTERRISPHSRRFSPSDRQYSPSDKRYLPSDKRYLPTDKQYVSSDKRYSPERQVSTTRLSPGPKTLPLRKLSPGQRRISPQRKEEYSRARRMSPCGHSSMDRRIPGHSSPSHDKEARGMQSHVREVSPRRQGTRYSPPRHHVDKLEYSDNRITVKNVRPAYELPPQASKEAKYTGGYRPDVREDELYSRGEDKRWQEREKVPRSKTISDDRKDVSRLQKFDIPRASERDSVEHEPKKVTRASRSPRVDRSPHSERYRPHSPSPRSPRRSWVHEKRRSPEAREPPPPPSWPAPDALDRDNVAQTREKFAERRHVKTSPVWEISHDKRREEFIRQRNADRESFEEEMRRRREVCKWKPLPEASPKEGPSHYADDDRSRRDAKFVRKDYDERRDYHREEDVRKPNVVKHEKEYSRHRDASRYDPEFVVKNDDVSKKQDFSSRIEEKKKEILKKQEQLQKEIDEVYKRAVDFTKKAELYKKGELNKELIYENVHHREGTRDLKDYDHRRYKSDHREHDDKDHEMFRHDNDGKKKPAFISKRLKAIQEISEKILNKFGNNLPAELKVRVLDELELSIGRIFSEMFGREDVSYIELVIKFNSKHNAKDEEKIFNDIMSSFPTHYRAMKRVSKDDTDIPVKSSRLLAGVTINKDAHATGGDELSEWNIMPNIVETPTVSQMAPAGMIMGAPVMVPLPTQYQFMSSQNYQEVNQPLIEEPKTSNHNLYLCKDDFQPIEEYETTQLKNFLIKEVIKITETSQGWAPDFTLTNQNSTYRHEVQTRDERSKDWLLGLDFSEFKEFNVLVYTTEELWYERAAVWLPGHSRYRNIEPLTKLKLQNKRLEGVNIGKWKLVKKIITQKGTRVYVDMPPSSARALERHKMQLSYELQKVNVFLKAVAVDKEAFDAGLNEPSVAVPPPSVMPMPALSAHEDGVIKIALKGKLVNQLQRIKKVGAKPVRKRILNSSKVVDTQTIVKKPKLESTDQEVTTDREKEKNIEDRLTEEDRGGRYELNELMTRIVEEELQTIMIKVWQALPDEPPTEADRFVAERLRNEVSDELRNVLGLNMTKRLLNIYNPLFVKIRFSCRPDTDHLNEFLSTYNISSFKCINAETNTFAARFTAISDFDNICTVKNVRCGSAKLIITPCYKFTQCPSKLNTIFSSIPDDKDKSKVDDSAINKTSNITNKTNLSKGKIVANEENKLDVNLIDNKKLSQACPLKKEKSDNSKELSPVSTNANKGSDMRDTGNSQNSKLSKVNLENKSKTYNNKEVKRIVKDIKKNIEKEEKQKLTQNKSSPVKIESKKTSVSPQKKSKNLLDSIEQEANKKVDAKQIALAVLKQEGKIVQKLSKSAKEASKTDIKALNLEFRKLSGYKLNVKHSEKNDSNKHHDDDEMNDEEILALISEGVIVDECSGSEEV